MKLFSTLATLGASLLVGTSAMAFELGHSTGTLELDKVPQRIVTFDLAQLDTLKALGIDVVGVPKSSYAGNLEQFKDYPVVGTLFEPDYAVLESLKPDLIIAGSRSAAAMPKLASIAPTIKFDIDQNDFINSVNTATQALGAAWGKANEAQILVDELQQNVQALQKTNTGKTAALLFIINDNIIAHAPGDRFGIVYEWTGMSSVLPRRSPEELNTPRPQPDTPEAAAAAQKRAADISAIAKADPDWLIVLDRGAINNGPKTAAATLAKHPELGALTAVKNGHVYYADPNSLYVITGGVSNVNSMTKDMLAADM